METENEQTWTEKSTFFQLLKYLRHDGINHFVDSIRCIWFELYNL